MKTFIRGLSMAVAVVTVTVSAAVAEAQYTHVQAGPVHFFDTQTGQPLAQTIQAQQSTGFVFTRNLGVGSFGPDVAALQNFLVARGVLPASVPGIQGGHFGPATQQALAQFQASVGIPATGFFGPITRSYLNSQGATGGVIGQTPSTLTCPAGFTLQQRLATSIVCVRGGSTTGGSTNGSSNGDRSGSIENFDILDDFDDEEVEEGDEEEVFGFEFEAEGSDITIEEIELLFESESSADRDQPWEFIETIRLLRDGSEVDEIDADDEDDWDDNGDENTITFEDLDEVVEEGDIAEFTIEIEIQDNVNESDLPISFEIGLEDDGLQARDEQGDSLEEGDADDLVEFTIERDGGGGSNNSDADFNVEAKTNNREERVSVNSPTSNIELYEADIEVEDNDVTIEELEFRIEAFGTGTLNLQNIIDNIELDVDGDSEDTVNITSSGSSMFIRFDNLDIDVDEDEEITISLEADIRQQSGNYNDDTRIRATLVSISGEDDDNDDFDENVNEVGGTITLSIN